MMWFSTAVISIYLHTALIIRIRTIVTTGLARPRIRSDSKIEEDFMDIGSRPYAQAFRRWVRTKKNPPEEMEI
jgi:hypothetical protein